ncbi:MAG: DsrE/DsrF/DrsH-like family protein [Gammaproteobacteria bacterium]
MNPGMNTPQSNTDSAFSPLSLLSTEERLDALESELIKLRKETPDANKVTLLLFSGEQDKIMAGLMIAATAASMGQDVTAFFTFWGINALKEKRLYSGKDLKEKMIDMMTPAGASHMGVSQLNMLGMGAMMLKQMMKDKNIVSVEELLSLCKESRVRIVACSMTMQVMGIRAEELAPDIEVAGAASYLNEASRSGCTLFI